MTLPQVYDLDEYWRKSPPVHVLVATYLEYKAPPIEELMAALGLTRMG